MTTTDRPAHRNEPAPPRPGLACGGLLPPAAAPPTRSGPGCDQVVSQTGGSDGAGLYPPSDPPSTCRPLVGAGTSYRPIDPGRDKKRGRGGGCGAAPIAGGNRPYPAHTGPAARTGPLPPAAYGYVSVRPEHRHNDIEQRLWATVERLAGADPRPATHSMRAGAVRA